MLSSQQLLKNGRYSILRSISTGPSGTIYLAQDTQRKTTVAILERPDANLMGEPDVDALARTQHDGLVRINNDFEERACRYSVTEPLSASASVAKDQRACGAVFDRLGAILKALNSVRVAPSQGSGAEISPGMVFTTADGKVKLFHPGSTGFVASASDAASPFAALEAVWESLDHITQKAIYNSYDEASLAVLESPADARTDIYALGAVFYKLLTGRDPVSAVERSIEMLDSNADPLKAPSAVNPAVDAEQSEFLLRMLEVRREGRFSSFDDAILSLPSAPLTIDSPPRSVVPEPEDFPLLEIPDEPAVLVKTPVATQPVAPPPVAPRPAAAVVNTPKVDTAAAFRPPFVVREPEVKPPSVAKPTPAASADPSKPKFVPRAESKPVFTTFDENEPAKSGAVKFAAIGFGSFFVAAGLGWALLGGSSPQQVDPSAAITAPANVVQETQAVEPPKPEPPPTETVVEADANSNASSPEKPRPQIADTRAVPQRTPKPAPKTEAKPAKKLTVEDLIN